MAETGSRASSRWQGAVSHWMTGGSALLFMVVFRFNARRAELGRAIVPGKRLLERLLRRGHQEFQNRSVAIQKSPHPCGSVQRTAAQHLRPQLVSLLDQL